MSDLFTHISFQPLIVTDLDRAKAFYRDKLGFIVDTGEPPGSLPFVFVHIGESPTVLQFQQRDSISKPDLPVLFLATNDVDAACAELRSRGVVVKEGPADTGWLPDSRWATILDSEGNIILIQSF